jgi:hypothetical protein
MVIRTEYRGTRYSMGSWDPLPAGFEIRFGSLNFQATGNGYPCASPTVRKFTHGAKRGPPRSPLHESPRHQRPPARTLRAHQRHDAAAASASARARRGQSDGTLSASPHNAARPSARRQPPRRGSARSLGRASPSVCAAPRRPTPPTPMPAPRCTGFPLAAMFLSPGILAPPPATSRPWALSTRCHPLPRTGMRSGTSPVYRTQ